jgi:threonine dehydrogenase-like Zn-dependent dehydrogenase
MKAIQAADRGGYDALRLVDIPRPQPQASQALVRVTSAGVTPLDRTVLAGLHPSARKLPLVPGNEGAGVVIEDPSGPDAIPPDLSTRPARGQQPGHQCGRPDVTSRGTAAGLVKPGCPVPETATSGTTAARGRPPRSTRPGN